MSDSNPRNTHTPVSLYRKLSLHDIFWDYQNEIPDKMYYNHRVWYIDAIVWYNDSKHHVYVVDEYQNRRKISLSLHDKHLFAYIPKD